MFADPQSVTINAVAKTLPRVSTVDRTSTYEDAANGLVLKVSHVNGKSRTRRTVRLDVTKTAADPLLDGVSRQYSMSAYLVIDIPVVGFSTTEVSQNSQGLIDYLDTAANLTKIVAGES